MRVCFFGTYEQDFVRNRTLVNGLRQIGWEVQECHVPLWEQERNKTGKYLKTFSLALRGLMLVVAYCRLLFQYFITVRSYDILLVGYIGHLDIPLAWLLTRFPRRPLVFSPLISLYDTLVDDRNAFSEQSLMSRFLRWLDRWACNRSDLILLDTEAHITYFVDTFELPRDKFVRVFVGAERQTLLPHPEQREQVFRVVFLGKFTPLHGLEVMIEAARLLRTEPAIAFHFIGSGQLTEQIRSFASRQALPNVNFLDWVEYEQIPAYLAQMDVCLGIFGTSGKARRVIPSKVFLALALGKPIITADTPAIRELLTDGESALLCEPGNPEALSKRILHACQEREQLERIAETGHRAYLAYASEEQIGCVAGEAMRRLKK